MKKDERCRLLYEAGAIVLLFFGAWVIAYTWLPSALRWPLGIICIVLEIVLQAALRILDKEGEWSSIVNVRKRSPFLNILSLISFRIMPIMVIVILILMDLGGML